jgi:hypothetical protein
VDSLQCWDCRLELNKNPVRAHMSIEPYEVLLVSILLFFLDCYPAMV